LAEARFSREQTGAIGVIQAALFPGFGASPSHALLDSLTAFGPLT
jgi:hypothetical protein